MGINTKAMGSRLKGDKWMGNVGIQECKEVDQDSKHSIASDA